MFRVYMYRPSDMLARDFSINRICVNVSSQHYRQQQKCDRIQSTYRN